MLPDSQVSDSAEESADGEDAQSNPSVKFSSETERFGQSEDSEDAVNSPEPGEESESVQKSLRAKPDG